MSYDPQNDQQQPPAENAPLTGLTVEQRQYVESLHGIAEQVGFDCDFLARTLRLVLDCTAPPEHLLQVARSAACRVARGGNLAGTIGRSMFDLLTRMQAAEKAQEPQEPATTPPPPAAAPTPLTLDVGDIPRELLQRRRPEF